MSPFKGQTGLKRVLNATGYSLDGLRAAFKGEAAFRQLVLLNVIRICALYAVGVHAPALFSVVHEQVFPLLLVAAAALAFLGCARYLRTEPA